MRLQSCCAACCVHAAWQPSSPCMGHCICRAADDQRQTMLAALMTNEARERCKQPAARAAVTPVPALLAAKAPQQLACRGSLLDEEHMQI